MASHGSRKSAPEGTPHSHEPTPHENKVHLEKHKADEGTNNAFQQHDLDHRQGSFEGTGNHARTGNRGHQ